MSEFKTPVKSSKPDGGEGEQLTIPPSPFLQRLGYGTGVSVMQLLRSPKEGQIRSPWALKMLNKRVKPNKVYSERLKEEAELLQKMSHPNIVGFRAFSGDKILYLGMEACDESLGDLIETQIEAHYDPFTPKQVLKVAMDISSALEYLHNTMHILHGDMKSFNVLVNGDFVICKLCDFGVTLPLDENGVFDKKTGLQYYGTGAWCAPEVIDGGSISDRTDVWAFGLTLWEMMALLPPHDCAFDEDFFAKTRTLDESAIINAQEEYCLERYGTRPDVPEQLSVEEYSEPLTLFHACTEHDAERRPSARDLAALSKEMFATCATEHTDS